MATKKIKAPYPFTAIVGIDKVKMSLVLNMINPEIGGVLLRGDKGTGKSLLVHGMKDLLPEISVFEGCRFNCDPDTEYRCADCTAKLEKGLVLTKKMKKMEVVDIPLNATEDRLLGSIDLERVLTQGVASFDPGILSTEHRNILYVDEINLLDDAIVDALLDAAAMNIVTVEREGISISYPTKFILIGSMNPEEGELRPQLLDRLALIGQTQTIRDASLRKQMLEDSILSERDHHSFVIKYKESQMHLAEAIRKARTVFPQVKLSPDMMTLIAWIGIQFNVDGHRADIIMERASKAHAALNGRAVVSVDDVVIAAELTLPHRMRKKPFEELEFSELALRKLVDNFVKKKG
jgi:magnesium chelatase subunit I